MEKALIFKHNLPYDVNVHPVAEDTITLVPRFENDKVRDLYIDYHLQGHTDSYLGLGQWKRDLEKMPARSLVYKNAKEITFNIDIVNYNEDVLNRNFAVTKTESGNYKFWWIKQIERIGQLKATLYKITLTLDYWWTYGIDNLFDNDKQVMIKRAHVRNYEQIEYPINSGNWYYRELKDIWSNPFINAGEEFKPNESNYIIEDYDILHTPFIINNYGNNFKEYSKSQLLTKITTSGSGSSPQDFEETILQVGSDIYYYWPNSLVKVNTKDCLRVDQLPWTGEEIFYSVGSLYNYKITLLTNDYKINPIGFSISDWAKESDNFYINDSRYGNLSNYSWIPPLKLASDPQKIKLSSVRIGFNMVWYTLTKGSILVMKEDKDWYDFMNDNFKVTSEGIYLFALQEQIALVGYGVDISEQPIDNYIGFAIPLTRHISLASRFSSFYGINYLRFDKFFHHFSEENIYTINNFDISKPRTLDEVKLHNDPYTKYRIIMPSKNQFDILNQYVNSKYPLGFAHICVLNPGKGDVLIIPFQHFLTKPLIQKDYFYGLSTNYNLDVIDNTNYEWPEESNTYDDYMLQNKSRLYQNQVDKYVHGGFKLAEDVAQGVGSIFSLNFGQAAKDLVKTGEDAYSIYQIHADYAAKMSDLKRTPGKWESKTNALLTLNTYKIQIPVMYKLILCEPIKTIVSKLFIVHGYNIGGYHKIYQFINGNHQRYFFNYLQAMNCLNIISKELSLAIKMAIQADLAQGIQIRHLRAKMFNPNGSWKYKNKFNDYDVNNVEYDLAIVPENENN